MKILVITGGNASERKISLISAKAVKKALEENGHQVKLFDFRKGFHKLKKIIPDFDVIFPMLHGEEGEGGDLQKFLSKSSKPFVGGDWKGFKKGWYKISFKRFCENNKIPTAPWKIIKTTRDIISFGFPSVLKASDGGSSKEVFILNSDKDLKNSAVKKLISSNRPLFVESYIPGIDITAGILDNDSLPLVEISLPKDKWFDYKNKYSGISKETPNAPSLNPNTRILIRSIASTIHNLLKLGQYSRIDFRVAFDKPYALEVNTIPGFTPTSSFPLAAKIAGLSFRKLVEKLVNSAIINKL